MAGYIQDPLQIINLIADNLRDRYQSGFPVLKEIIQNAHDAGCENDSIELELCLSNGLQDADHPLLRGPALYFINNGAFLESDYRAIRSFGLNRKAIEKTSIGKFGLGMKSVFHLCEAFFFLAGNEKWKYKEILNPWSGGDDFRSFHDDWNGFSDSDAALVKRNARPVFDSMDLSTGSWFLLWLPLRKREHLRVDGKEVVSIVAEFPGDEKELLSFLFDPDLPLELASLLPLLSRISAIRFWRMDEAGSDICPQFKIGVERGSLRVELTESAPYVRQVDGAVTYYRNERGEDFDSLIYSGRESLLDIPELRSLSKSPLWPKSYVRDELGMGREAPDKATAHSAVVFSRSNGKQPGNLKITWAVFLPVDGAKEEVRCEGDGCFRLTLHGYFFVDAGRVDIKGIKESGALGEDRGEPENEAELRRLWNIRLARKGTLPLVIPALKGFVKKAGLDSKDVWNLSDGLKESALFRNESAYICEKSIWACCLGKNGGEWQTLPAHARILPLPSPPASDPGRPWKTMPNLELLEKRGIIFVHKEAPHLVPGLLPQWNEEYLLEILHLRERDVFSDQGRLEYLFRFLSGSAVRPFLKMGTLQERLKTILNQAFVSLGTDLRQNRSRVQDFVSLIDVQRRYPVRHDAPKIIRELQRCETGVLIVAKEFDAVDDPGDARLGVEDSLALLRKLHHLINRLEQGGDHEETGHCRAIARDILRAQEKVQLRELLARARALKVLEAYDCLRGRPVAVSYAELLECRDNQMLFLYSQGTTEQQRLDLAPKLQEAVRERILLIRRKTADVVFGEGSPLVSCNADNVLESLGRKIQKLEPVEKRRGLLSHIAGADLSSGSRVRGLRYLLHGLEDRFQDDGALWVTGYDQSPVWGKLWRELESQDEDGWNLLDRGPVEEIPPNKWPKLAIREIRPESILKELRDRGTEGIDGERFTRDEREAVLKELAGDEDLWKDLPFHETVRGRPVSVVPGRSFLETDIPLPDELYSCADVIRRAEDPVVRAQQKDWLVPLSPEGVITIALRYEQPSKFWGLIMDNLDRSMKILTGKIFRDTTWLLDRDRLPVKPSDVLFLEKMQDEADRLLAVARGTFCSPGKLLREIRDHAAFDLLKEFSFARNSDGLEKLALLLGETDEYHVGVVDLEKSFSQTVKICARLPGDLHLPGWDLLARAIKAFSSQTCRDILLPEILRPIPADRIADILKWLREEHTRAGKGSKKDVLAAFNAYLAALVKSEGGRDRLPLLFLLSRDKDWKPADRLCADAEGVSDSHLLDDQQKYILRSVIVRADRVQARELNKRPEHRNLGPEIVVSADNLEDFFAEWEGLVEPEMICAFLSLLGDGPGMRDLAERYSGRHSMEWIRDSIPWTRHEQAEKWQNRELMHETDQHEAFAHHRFIVECLDGEMAGTISITGKKIDVPLKTEFQSLIIGGVYYEWPYAGKTFPRLRLRRPKTESSSELSRLLRLTAEYVLKKVYGQQDCDLSPLWEELDRSEQLDIRIAEQLVLNHVPFYMRLLGVQKHPRLKRLLTDWNEARYKREEYYESEKKREQYEKEERDLLREIQALLKSDQEVQDVVLEAVRAKMRDFQYTSASIPFELFQNADDALMELKEIKAYPEDPREAQDDILPANVRRFVVTKKDGSLEFVHWGRPVNSVGSGGFPGRERGFHHDLEKMLILSSSDKSDQAQVTGKFGLGFKSVLLASKKPRLLSGRLAAEIIAGLCPVPLTDSSAIRKRLNRLWNDRRWQATLIELPLSEAAPDSVMEAFQRFAGIMTIFSKQIRRIDIRFNHGNPPWEWAPERKRLSDSALLEIAELPFSGGTHQGGLAAYFRLSEGGILFALGPEGFKPLPQEVPAIWVVAPTKEGHGIGFAVNCLFDLDAGRARLSGSSAVNREMARDLGRSLGKALHEFYQLAREEWESVKTALRLEMDLSFYTLWSSLWRVVGRGILSRGGDEVSALVRLIFCNENGLGYLISAVDALPNGLWGRFQVLTRPKKVRIVLKGCLASEAVFTTMVKWKYFLNLIVPCLINSAPNNGKIIV